MIENAELEQILATAEDFSVIVELYPATAEPPFDPEDAILRYAAISNLSFLGEDYTRLITSFGKIKRTIEAELNSASVELDNRDNIPSTYELTSGYEGLIKVVRLISRNQSDEIEKSLILFAGRCEQIQGGNKESLSLKADQVFGAIDAEIPRRQFSPVDINGRTPQDVLFEGFIFTPQYGTVTYSQRQKRGGLFGLFGIKKTVTKNLQYSSFSDLDADSFLPEAFGRVQMYGTHIGYADLGTFLLMTTAFCEGEIENYVTFRTDDTRFIFSGQVPRYGKLGNVGGQVPNPDTRFNSIANGYFSRTALLFSGVNGSNIQTVDAAPGIIGVILGRKIVIPDAAGDWVTTAWSDNAAAIVKFALVSDDYGKLSDAWLNLPSFLEAYNFHNEYIFDTSYSDLIFTPDTDNFSAGDKELSRYFISTGYCGTEYFKLLAGDATFSDTFLRTAIIEPYDSIIPIEPPDPDPGPGGTYASLQFFIRRRYTTNIVVSEKTKLTDFIYKQILSTCNGFLSQDEQGRIKFNNKKPADWCLATDGIKGTEIEVDDVSRFVADTSRFLLIDPHTANAEIRIIETAVYSNDAPSISSDGDLDVSGGFGGGDGASTPMTCTLVVTGATPLDLFSLTIDGTEFSFRVGTGDTVATVAGFIFATINAHPVLSRKFRADWTPGTDEVEITYLSGTITLTESVEIDHDAPLDDPSSAPTATGASGGTFAAGDYNVCYTFTNGRGETRISPLETVTLTANQKIDVSSVSLPTGADSIKWYCSPVVNSNKLRFIKENDGSAFSITELPRLDAQIIPTFNRTGCEIMRVQMVFSDRAESRTTLTRSNVLKATYKWRLPNNKPVNQIEISWRDSTQDFRLLKYILRDKAHIEKIKKVNKEEINGQGIDNFNQVARIASSRLAELLDANFMYEWESDRTALLLEEGDVVAITDAGSGVVNFPVRVEQIEFDVDKGFPKADFTARKYATTLFDDSVAERHIPIILQTDQELDLYA